jgi:hypothetical protein
MRIHLFMICLLFGSDTQAQSLCMTTQQIRNLHNVRFTEIVQFKLSFQEAFSVDTFHTQMSVVAGEPGIHGYYNIKGDKDIFMFDGDKTIWLNLRDSTYKISRDAGGTQFTRSLLYWGRKWSFI